MSRPMRILFIVLAMSVQTLQGQVSTLGRDFWLTYPENLSPVDTSAPTLYLVVSAVDSISGTATNHRTGWHQTFWLAAGYTALMVVPQSDGMMKGSDTIMNRAIHVETSGKASVSMLSMRNGSADACNVLATPCLRNEYVIQCYPSPASSSGVKSCGELAVLALQNNTVVDITPSCPTWDGHAAGATFSVTLLRGECYQLQSVSGGDFSGTRVTARDCRQVAVFQGNTYARIPDSCATGNTLLDQSVPTAYWGRHFILTTTPSRRADRCRITAQYDSCQIAIGGAEVATIQANQTFEFVLPDTAEAYYLETSKPAYVCEYLASTQAGGDTGAPAMMVVNPVEQRVSDMAFYIPPSSQIGSRYVNIVAQTSGYSGIRIDSQVITSQFAPVTGNPNYVYASIPVTDGPHVIRGGSRGFTAEVLDLGRNDANLSFAHSCGAMLSRQANQININNVWTGLLSDTVHFCQGECADFSVSLAGSRADVVWDFHDGTALEQGLSVHHCLDSAGRYCVVARASDTNYDCFGDADFDSVVVPVYVHRTYCYSRFDTVHINNLPHHFGGFSYNGPVSNDTIRKSTRYWGCDSIIVYSLHVYDDSVYIDLYDSVCEGMPYRLNGFNLPAQSVPEGDSHFVSFRRVDSLLVYLLHLAVLPPPEVSIEAAPDENDGYVLMARQTCDFYHWSATPADPALALLSGQQAVTVSPFDVTTYHLLAGYRTLEDSSLAFCRSADSITLHPRKQATLWIPNAFCPSDGDNGTFRIGATEISRFEIHIYNRQGQIMFHSTDLNQSWDGSCKGIPQPQGAYSYVIRYADTFTPKAIQCRAGTVTLIR